MLDVPMWAIRLSAVTLLLRQHVAHVTHACFFLFSSLCSWHVQERSYVTMTIVGLCRLDDDSEIVTKERDGVRCAIQGSSPVRCLHFGLVRSADAEKLHVHTLAPAHVIAQVNCIAVMEKVYIPQELLEREVC